MFLWSLYYSSLYYSSLYYSPGVHWVVCVVTVATVLVYWLYSNWQPASQHQGGRTRSHALWFGHNRKLFYWLLRGRRLLCSASWRVSPPWKDCKPAGSPGNISKCKLVYHTQVFKHQSTKQLSLPLTFPHSSPLTNTAMCAWALSYPLMWTQPAVTWVNRLV